MKHFIRVFTFFSFIVASIHVSHGAEEEEKMCFALLTSKANALYGVDLANVWNGTSYVDISQYGNTPWQFFKKNREKVAGDPFFNSQRNNIGTIILPINYITTQYVPFGNSTNFKFPIDNSGSLIGEQFVNFKNQIVYTHHNIFDGNSFLSCWYLKITPKAPYTYSDLAPSNYFTNILDGDSGFEIESSDEVNLWGWMGTWHYLITKSKVSGAAKVGIWPAEHLEKLFTIEILHIIFDNQSSYFNEYETYPLQVDAMTNADTYSTAWSIQQDFIGRVMNETCLSSVHSNTGSLPAMCSWTYQSLSWNTRTSRSLAYTPNKKQLPFLSQIYSFLIPSTFARLSNEDAELVKKGIDPSDTGIGHAIMMDQNFDYYEFEKLNKIPSKIFRDYFLLATNYQYELGLQTRLKSAVGLSEYDKIISNCGIPYDKRLSLLKEWLKNLDVQKFSVENLEYPDAKIGDCVLPFPDKRNIDRVIPGSFESNRRYAEYLIAQKNSVADPRIESLKTELRTLESQYSQALLSANQVISTWDVAQWQKMLKDASVEFEPKIQHIQNEIYSVLNPGAPSREKSRYPILSYILIGIWVLLAFLLVFIRRR